MATIYQRGKTWWVKYTDEHGQRVQKSFKTTKRKDAELLKAEIEVRLAKVARGEVEPVPVRKDFPADRFWDEYEKLAKVDNKRSASLDVERTYWREFIRFAKPATLGAITTHMGERYKAYLKNGERIAEPRDENAHKRGRKLGRLSDYSINSAIKHCRIVYNHAIKKGFVTGENPFAKVSLIKIDSEPKAVFLRKEQIVKVLKAAEAHGRDIHLVFALGIYAGLRKNEIVSAKWEWVRFHQGFIEVPKQDGDFKSKSRRRREIPLASKLREVLERYRPDPAAGYICMPETSQGSWRYRWEFDGPFQKVLKAADVTEVDGEAVTPHTLRHTFASTLVMGNVSVYKVAEYLGHTDVKVTRIYSHLSAQHDSIDVF